MNPSLNVRVRHAVGSGPQRPHRFAGDLNRRPAPPLAWSDEVAELLLDNAKHVIAAFRDLEHAGPWAADFGSRLASRPGVVVETFVPSSVDAYIERFNSALAAIDLASARSILNPVSLRRVVIVPDARMLCNSDGLVLARLAACFPGSGLRLLMLSAADSIPQCDRLLDVFARAVEVVDIEEKSTGLARRARTREERAERLADDMTQETPSASQDPSAREPLLEVSPARAPVRSVSLAATPTGTRFAAVDFSRESENDLSAGRGEPSPFRRALGWTAAMLSLLLVSALVVVLLHRDRGPGTVKPRNTDPVSAPLMKDAGSAGRTR